MAGSGLPLSPHPSKSSSPFKAQLQSHLLHEAQLLPNLHLTVYCFLSGLGLYHFPQTGSSWWAGAGPRPRSLISQPPAQAKAG